MVSTIWRASNTRNRKRREWRRKGLVGFPKSLKKWIRETDGRLIRIRGYYYFSDRLNRLPFKLKRHRCLPLPERQVPKADHCLHHALIKSLESRIRIARWRLDPRHDTPRLSIQHAIDVTAPMDDPDIVYTFLGIHDYAPAPFANPFANDEIGVTTAINWPYRGPDVIDPPNLPLPRDVPGWERFRLADVRNLSRHYVPSSLNFENVINDLILELKSGGPFIAWYRVRITHRDARYIFTREGRSIGFIHTVLVTGWKKWREDGELLGYWEFLDSYGLGQGRYGFGRIAFDAVDGVEIPIPLV